MFVLWEYYRTVLFSRIWKNFTCGAADATCQRMAIFPFPPPITPSRAVTSNIFPSNKKIDVDGIFLFLERLVRLAFFPKIYKRFLKILKDLKDLPYQRMALLTLALNL